MPDQIKDINELFNEVEDEAIAKHRAWLADPVAQAAEAERVKAMIARQPEDAAEEDIHDDEDDVEVDDGEDDYEYADEDTDVDDGDD